MRTELSIAFTGDIGFDKYMDRKWEDKELISKEILDFLHSADHVVANVEGPIIESVVSDAVSGVSQLRHSIDPAAVSVLQKIGADVWNICNNHIMDVGEEGLIATLTEAENANAITLGAGRNIKEASRPVYFDECGGVGLLAVGYDRACRAADDEKCGCLNFRDMDIVKSAIEEIKSRCKYCIIVAHDGEEFTALPTSYTRNRYHKYLEFGADIVVAHHPHVPMNYETVGDKIIFYSLGNFIFDTPYQRSQKNTEKGILLKLIITEEKIDFVPFGIRIDRENEHVVKDRLPDIFENVSKEEYELLAPLAAKMFIENTKRQVRYLNPGEYENASEKKWNENFSNPMRSGRVEGQLLDFAIVTATAAKEKSGDWKKSTLKNVKKYMLEQIES